MSETTEVIEVIEVVAAKELNVTAIVVSAVAVASGILLAKGIVYLIAKRKNNAVVDADTPQDAA